MNYTLTIIVTLFTSLIFAQKNPTEKAQPIVQEGKLLYRSEMASWYGTDLFLENTTDRNKIGGYFSYTEGDSAKCVFFSKSETPEVIGTIEFDQTYNVETAKVDMLVRDFTRIEIDLYVMRKNALSALQSDTIFKFFQGTNPNLIPLIQGESKKVYVLTGPEKSGVVLFGNDYLLTFDENNELIKTKRLHNNLIAVEYGGEEEEGNDAVGAIHSHNAETGDFITATDICTLMLYSRYAGWKTHTVVSKKYMNMWNCETNSLTVLPTGSVKKIVKDQEKKERKRKKK